MNLIQFMEIVNLIQFMEVAQQEVTEYKNKFSSRMNLLTVCKNILFFFKSLCFAIRKFLEVVGQVFDALVFSLVMSVILTLNDIGLTKIQFLNAMFNNCYGHKKTRAQIDECLFDTMLPISTFCDKIYLILGKSFDKNMGFLLVISTFLLYHGYFYRSRYTYGIILLVLYFSK